MLLALTSSLLWGVADFLGGNTSRRAPTLLVVLISQSTGLLLAFIIATASDSFAAPNGYLPWAAGAGVAGACAVLLFYRALAVGTVGIVAPLAALGVIVPVVIGLVGGTLPSVLCLAGIVIAIGGVVTTAGANATDPRPGRHGQSILLAIGAAAGFGLLQYAISGGSRYSTVMTMVGMRATSVPPLSIATYLALRRRPIPKSHPDESGLDRRLLVLIAVIGLFDMGANLLFAEATVTGALAIAAVLGSLYPAATVLLARIVNNERLSRPQQAGVLIAITGVAMISLGS